MNRCEICHCAFGTQATFAASVLSLNWHKASKRCGFLSMRCQTITSAWLAGVERDRPFLLGADGKPKSGPE